MNDQPRSVRAPLAVAVVALSLFGGIVCGIQSQSALIGLDKEWATSINEYAGERPASIPVFLRISDLSGRYVVTGIVLIVGVLLALQRHYLLAGVWIIVVVGGGMLNEHVKDIIERPRQPGAHATGWSFPSGHSMRAIVCYGFLACLAARMWTGGRRLVAVVALLLIVGLIGFSRMYLGNHYFSDVVGAYALGAAWIAGWITVVNWAGNRKSAGEPNA